MTLDDYLATFSIHAFRLDHICSTSIPGRWLVRIVNDTTGDQINTCERTIHMALADALARLSRGDVYNPGRRVISHPADPDCGPVSVAKMIDLSALMPTLVRR